MKMLESENSHVLVVSQQDESTATPTTNIPSEDNESLYSIEMKLRAILQEKPKNGKVMSKLACILLKQSKQQKQKQQQQQQRNGTQSNGSDTKLRNEAMALAHQAIHTAPTRPFGYTALSQVSLDDKERTQALERAIQCCSNEDRFRMARLTLSIRLLLEPRQYEEEQLLLKSTTTTTLTVPYQDHPKRRTLSIQELDLYKRICDDLKHTLEDTSTTTTIRTEDLCQLEFRLGQFFRKKLPSKTYQSKSSHHFQQCLRFCKQSSSSSKSSHCHEMAAFWLATIASSNASSQAPLIDTCPPKYIIGLYSTFAKRFDTLLVETLQYQTPTKLRQLFQKSISRNTNTTTLDSHRPAAATILERACDLGCGTGLSGMAFQDLLTTKKPFVFVGIDLSNEMLEKAKSRGCYSQLIQGDLVPSLKRSCCVEVNNDSYVNRPNSSATFDLILACDVFCYIGNLSPIFDTVHRCLSSNGYFCFSTELLVEDKISTPTPPTTTMTAMTARTNPNKDLPPFQLHSCARFCHRKEYIVALAKHYKFTILGLESTSIRKNQGKDVCGLLVILQSNNHIT